LYWWTIAF